MEALELRTEPPVELRTDEANLKLIHEQSQEVEKPRDLKEGVNDTDTLIKVEKEDIEVKSVKEVEEEEDRDIFAAFTREGYTKRMRERQWKLGNLEKDRWYANDEVLLDSDVSLQIARTLLSHKPDITSLKLYENKVRKTLGRVLKRHPETIPLWVEYHSLIYRVHDALGYGWLEKILSRQFANEGGNVLHILFQHFSVKALPLLNEVVVDGMLFEKAFPGGFLCMRFDSKSEVPYIQINRKQPEKGAFGGSTWKF